MAAAVVLASACAAPEETAPLLLAFETETEEARALAITVRIVEGTCAEPGDEQRSYTIRRDETGPPTVPLPPGSYAVIAEARGAECTIFARGCAERALPDDGASFFVVLATLADPPSLCGMCETCDGAGACAVDMGPECTCLEEPTPACSHEQVVCEIEDGADHTARKGRFVLGTDPARPICSQTPLAGEPPCGDALRSCVTSAFAMAGHLHRVRFRVHDGDPSAAGPAGGGDRIVFRGPESFEAIAQDGSSAVGSFVGAAVVEEARDHDHPIECRVYELEGGAEVTMGVGSSFTVRDAGGTLRYCVSDGTMESCAGHLRCVVL